MVSNCCIIISVFIPVVDLEVEVLGEGIEVGPIVEEVLRLGRKVTLTIAEDTVGGLFSQCFPTEIDVILSSALPIIIVPFQFKTIIPAIASPVLPADTSINIAPTLTVTEIIDAFAEDLTDTVGYHIVVTDIPRIEPHAYPLIIVMIMDLANSPLPNIPRPHRMMGLGTKVSQIEAFLSLTGTGRGTADGVNLAVDNVMKHTGIHIDHACRG
jgi:hypothetical protein